jgi:hypothetical protein
MKTASQIKITATPPPHGISASSNSLRSRGRYGCNVFPAMDKSYQALALVTVSRFGRATKANRYMEGLAPPRKWLLGLRALWQWRHF